MIHRIRKPYLYTILHLILLNFSFVALLFLLRHAWYMSESETEIVKTVYPRTYFLFVLIGRNSVNIFTLGIIAVVVLNFFLLFRFITLCQNRATAILFFSSVVVALIASEITLRTIGYSPGLKSWAVHSIHAVRKIKDEKGFYADESGILKIDSSSRDEIAENIAQRETEVKIRHIAEVYELAEHFVAILDGKIKNDLAELYFSILKKPENMRSEWETAVVNYVHSPINKDCFRSIDFKRYKPSKSSVLLLGDSFTWGHSAINKTNSFADILLSKGYVVYNTGISTTDVAQYLAVAKKYIPELLPDFVIVNFYLGNDISYYKREVLPYHSTFYCTNAGYLLSCPHGKYISKEEAYQYALAHSRIPINEQNIVERILSKTVIGTRIIEYNPVHTNLFPYLAVLQGERNEGLTAYYKEVEKQKFSTPYSNYELGQIKSIAEQYGSKFILSSIPDYCIDTLKTAKDFPDLFGGLEYSEMKVERSDYESKSGIHFNEQGHRKYAEFLDSLIRVY